MGPCGSTQPCSTIRPPDLPGSRGRYIHLQLQATPARPGRSGAAHQGDCRSPLALWASPYAWRHSAREMDDQHQADIPFLHRMGPAIAQQGSQTMSEDEAPGETGPALQPNRTWAMDVMHKQLAMGKKIRVLTVIYIFSKLSAAVEPRLSYRAENVSRIWNGSACRSAIRRPFASTRAGVHLHRSGSPGLSPRRDPRLLTPRQANRQRLYRVPEW